MTCSKTSNDEMSSPKNSCNAPFGSTPRRARSTSSMAILIAKRPPCLGFSSGRPSFSAASFIRFLVAPFADPTSRLY